MSKRTLQSQNKLEFHCFKNFLFRNTLVKDKNMKTKFYLIITMLTSFLMFIACNSQSVEEIAVKQMKKTVLELAKNPDTFNVSDIQPIISEDSLVILHCITRGQNGFGGYSIGQLEYIYFISPDGKRYEAINDLESDDPKQTSVIKSAKESYYEHYDEAEENRKKQGLTKDEYIKNLAGIMARFTIMFSGREIE